jgi:hypothetical protein
MSEKGHELSYRLFAQRPPSLQLAIDALIWQDGCGTQRLSSFIDVRLLVAQKPWRFDKTYLE